jgi:hypothetical protein
MPYKFGDKFYYKRHFLGNKCVQAIEGIPSELISSFVGRQD